MLDFSRKTYKELLNDKLMNVPDSIDKQEGSIIFTSLAPNSLEISQFYEYLQMFQNQTNYRTAEGSDLEHIVEYRGLTRQEATKSIKQGAFNVEIPEGTRFSSLEGNLIYVSGNFINSQEGIYYYEMTCETAGQVGNTYVGDLLAINYVNGLKVATLGAIIISGADEETDEALRQRFELSFKQQAFGGNVIAYKEKIESIDGVGLCQVYPADQYEGGSTLLCVIIDDEYNLATNTLIDSVQEVIAPIREDNITNGGYGFAPIGAKPKIQTGTYKDIVIECSIQFSSGDIDTHRTEIENKIKDYIHDVMSQWATMTITSKIDYNIILYRARLIQYMLDLDFIVNVTNLTINNADADLVLQEDKTIQEVARFGELIVNG